MIGNEPAPCRVTFGETKLRQLPQGETTGTFVLAVAKNAPPGMYSLFLQAVAKVSYSRNPEAARAAARRKQKIEQALKNLLATTKPKGDEATSSGVKKLQAAKDDTEKRAKQLAEAAKPKIISVSAPSTILTVRIVADERQQGSE